MKPNIFCLVVDALSAEQLNEDINAMPFVKNLMKSSVVAKNCYSQGPYTEAALTPFYTGRDNLDFCGNFFRGNEIKTNLFESLVKNGYDTICWTQPVIFPTPMERGINLEKYGICYTFNGVWDYRLNYYRSLKNTQKINDNDYEKVIQLLDSNFDFWIQYLIDCKDNNFKATFINKYADRSFDFDTTIKNVKIQRDSYYKDKKYYIDELFKLGEKHPVFSIPNYLMYSKISNNAIYEKIQKEYRELFDRIIEFNSKHNINSDSNFTNTILKVLKSICKGSIKDIRSALYNYHYYRRICNTQREINSLFDKKSNYKPEPSILEYFNDFKELQSHRDMSKPYFAMMHISDLHTPEIFFSIDSDSYNQVSEELDVMNNFLDNIPDNFSGNIIYYLSMRYVDFCIEKIYNWLKSQDSFKNTVFLITSDHGSSFAFNPIRHNVVNNMHIENYHIPCIFHSESIRPFYNENYYSTKDIVKTILNIANVSNPEATGLDIIENNSSNYSITEYLGGGCPDITRRKIMFVIRDKKYHLCAWGDINSTITLSDVTELFDITNDAKETTNLIKFIDKFDVSYLIKILNERLNTIKGYLS